MNEQLRIRLGEYLLSKGHTFGEIQDVTLDPATPTVDIWYHADAMLKLEEVEGIDLEDFLTFLVTGGK